MNKQRISTLVVTSPHLQPFAALTDGEVVARVLTGDKPLFELIMRRYNQRLFRVAWSVLRNKEMAEDALQEAYLLAFSRLHQVRDLESIAGWLSTIVTRSAFALARQKSLELYDATEDLREELETPLHLAEQRELGRSIEAAISRLPLIYRMVFVMREVEQLSVEETARLLEVSVGTVKSRLFRAKHELRRRLRRELEDDVPQLLLQFAGPHCDRVVKRVLARFA